jgi:hypothetical protein
MRLIGQEVDALAEHQLNEFAGERLLTGLALKCRSRPEADNHFHIGLRPVLTNCNLEIFRFA